MQLTFFPFNDFIAAVLAVLAGAVYAELLGYFVHRLLHSDRIQFLSRAHMTHHLVLYGPLMPKRTESYRPPPAAVAIPGAVGLEWLLPLGTALGVTVGLLTVLGVAAWLQVIGLSVAIAWGVAMFNYIHDGMHVRMFWMAFHPLTRRLFRRARRLHDLHHILLNDEGRMFTNFGICFFVFDRIFGTYANKMETQFNRKGYEAARERFAYALPNESR